MKLSDLFEDVQSVPLKLNIDNPGGSWLAGKRQYIIDDGTNRFGTPKTWGSITGCFNRPALVQVSVLQKIKGMSGEHDNVRHDDLKGLTDFMRTTNKLPIENNRQYVPYIMVDYSGQPWINEGNHRIMAARDLGWKYLPVEIKYFTGGEAEKGPLNPKDVEAMDKAGHAAGFSAANFSGGSTSKSE